MPRVVEYEWRGRFESAELNVLHAQGFEHAVLDYDWWDQVSRHSLGWVCARADASLVGFVNVAWDGGSHAFILDTLVPISHRRKGIGMSLVKLAADEASAAGCEWLHVDFEDHLKTFYLEGCGFASTDAGLIAL